jgi:hypothetical protein
MSLPMTRTSAGLLLIHVFCLQELVGNPGLVSTIKQWLFQWDAVHLHGASPEQPKGAGQGKPKDMGKKAVMLSGPPGIGKTSSAHIIARCGCYCRCFLCCLDDGCAFFCMV